MENFLYDLWKTVLGPALLPLWNSVVFLRLAVVCLATALVTSFYFRESLARRLYPRDRIERDAAIFTASTEIASEPLFNTYLNLELFNGWSNNADFDSILDFLEFIRREQNRYLNRRVRTATEKLSKSLADLMAFVGNNFFDTVDGRRGLHPEKKNSPDAAQRLDYARLAGILNTKIEKTFAAYKTYLRAGAERLNVRPVF